MREVCDDKAFVDGKVAFQTHALAAALRLHIDDRVVVNSKVDPVANDPSETHGHSLTHRDIAGTSTGVFVMSVDKVEGAEEVASI